MSNTSMDRLAEAVRKELEDYRRLTAEALQTAVEETAKATVRELKKTSPKRTGDYARSWAQKTDPKVTGANRTGRVVYVKKPKYRIAHLLEKPHVIAAPGGRTVGRSKAQPHIAQAERKAIAMLEKKLKQYLSGGNANGQ